MTPKQWEAICARDSAFPELPVSASQSMHDRRALIAYVKELREAAGKVICLRCGNDGSLSILNASGHVVDRSPCPDCEELRELLK